MTGDWKPGQVALVTIPGRTEQMMVRYRTSNRGESGWYQGWGLNAEGKAHYSDELSARGAIVRPLAVIDPEDRQAVERLLSLLDDRGWYVEEDSWQDVQGALREFAAPTPPRPDEPQGLGAVVEDIYGELWVRVDNYPEPWRVGNASHKWADIDVGRVLSEGIEQP